MIPLVTVAEMQEIENTFEARSGSIQQLVERAGTSLASSITDLAPSGEIVMLIGPGTNGEDGMTAAEILRSSGRSVTSFTFLRDRSEADGPNSTHVQSDAGVAGLTEAAGRASVVVDAILGTGTNRPLEGASRDAIQAVNDRGVHSGIRLAVDVPSGVNADTGTVDGVAFRADRTLCMGFVKRGVALYPGAGFAGTLSIASLGLPRDLASGATGSTQESDVAGILPVRDRAGNKGLSGRMMFIGGSQDFTGAPVLASMGAYRAGAGLVEIAVPRCALSIVASHALEPVYRPLPELHGKIDPVAVESVREGLGRARVAVIGSGMGSSPETVEFMQRMLAVLDEKHVRVALIDADGLNGLSQIPEWWELQTPLVLTPHPGEMSRLTGLSIPEIQADRLNIAVRYAQKWRKTVVLKGAGTVIASPSGSARVNPTGGPNLATAGTGDVLSGVIGGLLAQGCDPFGAAVAGVYLHGAAGDMLLAELGDAGTVAGDLLNTLPKARLEIVRGQGKQ